jgi:hypothetical protein
VPDKYVPLHSLHLQLATDPNRVLLHEGDVVTADNHVFYAFLFNDMLLLSKTVSIGDGKLKAVHENSIYLRACAFEVLQYAHYSNVFG